jgi:p-aminobenzoyl-glutamate transporter AbgT
MMVDNRGQIAVLLAGAIMGFITFIFVMLIAAGSLLAGTLTLVVMGGLSAGAVHRHPLAGGYLGYYAPGFATGFAANLAVFLLA